VGPFANPHETYKYYSLPFCHTTSQYTDGVGGVGGDGVAGGAGDNVGGLHHSQKLGENMAGDRKATSPYDVTFGDQVPWRSLCEVDLSPSQVASFKAAVHDDYYFEMFVEDLPMWGYIGEITGEDLILGEVEDSRTFLFPHLHFKMSVNENRIVAASVFTHSHRRVDITDTTSPVSVTFSYSVEWENDFNLKHEDRMSRYVDSAFLPSSLEIHWLSILNSLVLVLLLTAFLSVILLRILKKDFAELGAYMDDDEEQSLAEDDKGWKLLHGDVFRFPKHKMLFSACQGAGAQLLLSCFLLLAATLAGGISVTRRGALLTSMLVLYCLTSIVGGYVSSGLYKQMGGTNWVNNVLLTSVLFPFPLLVIFGWANSVAAAHGSTSALPFGTILIIVSLFVFVAFPLTVVGGILGRNLAKDFNAPTRTKKLAREIPSDIPFVNSMLFQLVLSGFLPFSAIYIELHYIFASVWGHQLYTLYGILFLAFLMLVVVTAFITIAMVYFQLTKEDHRWWWRSFLNGGSTGMFIFVYAVHYFYMKSSMDGLLQTSFYFGYMSMVSLAIAAMLGSVGFFSTLVFVRYIYSRVKCD
jgi:hypothetical protein